MLLKYNFHETFLEEEKTKTREDKRMIELDLKNKIPPKCPLWAYIKKISTLTFWFMVIPLGPHSVYTLCGEPKAL
jgi:hypothetical protein